MKKILSIMLVITLMFTMVACSSDANDKPSGGQQNSETPTPNNGEAAAISDFEYNMIPFLKDYAQYRTDEEINVLYLVCTTAAEYFPNSFAVWEPMLKEHNINLELLGPPTYSDESMLNTLESALASKKYDLILLYPITPAAITPMLDTAWDTYKTPILAYAFDPATQCGHYYLGTSYYKAGEVMGQSIIDYVDANASYYDTLKTIPVAVYKNSAGAEQYQRIVGAVDLLKADGRFSIIDEYEANGEAACLAATETLLSSRPDVEIILTQIDNDVTGAYQAVTSGTKVSEYLSIWGFDATGVVCSQMAQDGIDGFVQGSTLIGHEEAGKALNEIIPILVGASKKGVKIEFKSDEFEKLGTILGDYYVTVTPENVKDYYTVK